MEEKYFVISIGGTGMRCVEAFTHLCAIGMFDNKEIDILSIDTDSNNGNKGRSEQLIERYNRIKGGSNSKPTQNSFFSAKLNIHKFDPNYSGDRESFELISSPNSQNDKDKKENKALADLFFDDDVQTFDLSHGYRAQTHLGSHLMYHAILEAARNVNEGGSRKEDQDLADFLDKIIKAGENARVFIFGSMFGGTGASSIPIIPKALEEAIKIKDSTASLSKGAKFGCALLSDYFEFKVPDATQKKKKKVIADSTNFSLNSQAALMFYINDKTVKETYDLMYHIGWPKKVNYSKDDSQKDTITGGGEQKNSCHIAELMCACAVHDFFNRDSGFDEHEILYRSANQSGNSFDFEFQDFFGQKYSDEFKNKLGSFFALSNIILKDEDGAFGANGVSNLISNFKNYDAGEYSDIPKSEQDDLNDYMKSFAFNFSKQGAVVPGWLFQIQNSVGNDFLFNKQSFSANSNELKKFSIGELFDDKKHQFATGFLKRSSSAYQEFREIAQKEQSVKPNNNQYNTLSEKFLALSYNSFSHLYNVIVKS
jgi:hypothetical protein